MKHISKIIFLILLVPSVLYAQEYSFKFEGLNRAYEVHLPQDFQANMPVVFCIHGWTESISWIRDYTKLHEFADTSGFIVVYPNAYGIGWNMGHILTAANHNVNDVGFISALIDTLQAQYNADLSRVYCCGFSMGGEMTYKLTGELGHRFAAIASIAGLLNEGMVNTCKPVRPFPILHMHGTLDSYETWYGSAYNTLPVDETINFWLENNGCSIPGDTVLLPDLDPNDGCRVEKISYTNCSGDGQLIFYKIPEGGHNWPGSEGWKQGLRNMDIHASAEILNFFKQFENPLWDMAFIANTDVPQICTQFSGDSISIRAELYNPESHPAEVFAIIQGDSAMYQDTLQLFDDGLSGDGDPNDNIWGVKWFPEIIDEDYKVSFIAQDLIHGLKQEYFWSPEFSILSDVPDVTIRVKDFYTGDPIQDCEVDFVNYSLQTDEDGEIHFQDCSDEYTFIINASNYSKIVHTYVIHSDTVFDVSLEKDSYLRIIDNSSGEPIYRATINYHDNTSGTDNEGLATVQIPRNGKLEYIIEHIDYFTEEDSVIMTPGDTTTIELTSIFALIEFLVSNESGPVGGATVNLNGLEKQTGVDGIALFSHKSARREYYYSIEETCRFLERDTFFLEIDTLLQITLIQDTVPPFLDVTSSEGEYLASSSISGNIYVVPSETDQQIDSILSNSLHSESIKKDIQLELDTTGLITGEYWLYVIDYCQKISNRETIGVITDINEHFRHGIRIWPNPAKDQIYIETERSGRYLVDIISIHGQILYSSNLNRPGLEIDFSSYSSGIYFITIRTDNSFGIWKIVKY